jgi:hypothetical protein
MWATRQTTKNIKYSYVDEEDKENLVARSSDDKSENAESEGSKIPYGLAPARRSRWPFLLSSFSSKVQMGAGLATAGITSPSYYNIPLVEPSLKCHST